MVALKKASDAPGLDLTAETPVPEMGPDDVLIRIVKAGICGTDRHIYEWDAWSRRRIKIGTTIGHEFVGVIAAVGADVQTVQVGQRVSGEGHIGCNRCEACRTGMAHVCDNVRIIGIDRDGTFAGYMSLPERNVWPIHASIPDNYAAIMDPLGNAVHTVMAANVSGRTVLVSGVGIIGLMAVPVARAAGASRVIAVDVNAARLDLARRLGADECLSAREEDWPERVKKLTDGRGVHVVLEMSGAQPAIRGSLEAMRNGGTMAVLGLPSGDVSLDLARHLIFKGATFLGINGRRMFETWYQMESLLLSGRVNLDPIITHVIPLKDYRRGFELMQAGEAIKVILEIG